MLKLDSGGRLDMGLGRGSRPPEEVRFAIDSVLEEDGFELVVPLSKRTAVPGSPFGFPVDGTVLRAFYLRKRRFRVPGSPGNLARQGTCVVLNGWCVEACFGGVTGWAISMSGRSKGPDLEAILNDLYASGINASISWIWDDGFHATLRAPEIEECALLTIRDAVLWLRDKAFLRARIFAIACCYIACCYEDADDLDRLRFDPAFKMACGRLPDTGRDLCSQPTVSRWENVPSLRDLIRLISPAPVSRNTNRTSSMEDNTNAHVPPCSRIRTSSRQLASQSLRPRRCQPRFFTRR
jgi:hypothetical protein